MKLEIKNLKKQFGDTVVLEDVNLTFSSGHIYGFVGRNGSGKSVLLKMICGFYSPSEGMILQDGRDYTKANEFPKNTRALIEKPKFLPDLTGYENLELLASIQNKIGKKEIEEVDFKPYETILTTSEDDEFVKILIKSTPKKIKEVVVISLYSDEINVVRCKGNLKSDMLEKSKTN